ncbi:hypothetical protein C922_05821 [Plasmodium inui San Antonio 1]|uniref:Pv-fam-d protein n=1 Tax=Plasmodium inui San Antonio 1 TaxID=1237626 RepID=W6ZWX2_9APIC|nr:hypothetical protein C922_05821 [Plasmodium inui San Antonio 1]EUD63798.1 hypothetical protein C922_05821 [Plasmodium inui San Antonio 1]
MFIYGRTFLLTLLLGITTYIHKSKCYRDYSNDSYDIFHETPSAESNFWNEQKYAAAKNNLLNSLEQNDDFFADGLNAKVHDDHDNEEDDYNNDNDDESTEKISHFMHKYASEEMLPRSRKGKGFQNDSNSWKTSSNHEEIPDEFNSYDRFECSFYELESGKHHGTEAISAMTPNKFNIQKSAEGEEYHIPIKISRNPYRNKSVQSSDSDYGHRKKRQSWLQGTIKRRHSKFRSEMKRFMKIASGRGRISKGRGLSGYFKFLCNKYRVFTPLAISVCLNIFALYITYTHFSALLCMFLLLIFSLTVLIASYYLHVALN